MSEYREEVLGISPGHISNLEKGNNAELQKRQDVKVRRKLEDYGILEA